MASEALYTVLYDCYYYHHHHNHHHMLFQIAQGLVKLQVKMAYTFF